MRTTLQKAITQLVVDYGSERTLGLMTGVDLNYISKLNSGEENSPPDEILERLGIEKITIYNNKWRRGTLNSIQPDKLADFVSGIQKG